MLTLLLCFTLFATPTHAKRYCCCFAHFAVPTHVNCCCCFNICMCSKVGYGVLARADATAAVKLLNCNAIIFYSSYFSTSFNGNVYKYVHNNIIVNIILIKGIFIPFLTCSQIQNYYVLSTYVLHVVITIVREIFSLAPDTFSCI